MSIVYVNIGSNLGDKKILIEKAIEIISKTFGYYCKSRFVESDPWGFVSTNRFLNIGLAFKTDLPPEKVLDTLQEIEQEISKKNHRDKDGNYADREIDIDIMAIDNLRISTERLQVPHPHLLSRDFFYGPLKELAPDWEFPSE